ncbi:fibronectin type II domain-containing protein [Pannonibacter tanglangensis]
MCVFPFVFCGSVSAACQAVDEGLEWCSSTHVMA